MKRAFAAFAAALLLSFANSAHADIWVNEFHYDDPGTDVSEFMEIVVSPTSSGIDLSTVTLSLYNGSNGQVYSTTTLDLFTAGSNVDGFQFYTFNFPSNGIQNGSPDGWALDQGGSLLEFLSYEGVLTATNGIASGLQSIDIGVSETNADPSGVSLQRIGTGSVGADFTWTGPIANTSGGINTGQSFSAVPEPTSAGILGLVALTGCFVRRRR